MQSTRYSCQIFLWNWIISTEFRKKNIQIQNLKKIRPVEARLFYEDGGQTDMKKLIVAFRNFARASKPPKHIAS